MNNDNLISLTVAITGNIIFQKPFLLQKNVYWEQHVKRILNVLAVFQLLHLLYKLLHLLGLVEFYGMLGELLFFIEFVLVYLERSPEVKRLLPFLHSNVV